MTAEEARLPIPLRLPAPLTLPPAVDAPAPFATAYAEAASWRTSSRPCHFCQPSRRHAAGERAPPMVTAAGYGVQSRWAPTLGGGGIYGVQNNTMKFPWFSVWCTSIIRGATTAYPFSSCPLACNVQSFLHRDGTNEAGTHNIIMPCSRWHGGQFWEAHSEGSVFLDCASGPGRLMNSAKRFYV